MNRRIKELCVRKSTTTALQVQVCSNCSLCALIVKATMIRTRSGVSHNSNQQPTEADGNVEAALVKKQSSSQDLNDMLGCMILH